MSKFLYHDINFYHGTHHDFDRFFPLSHFGTQEAAQIILDIGPHDFGEYLNAITQKKRPDMPDTAPVSASKPRIITAKFNINKTYEISDINTHHDIMYYKDMFLYHIFDELKLNGIPEFYDNIFVAPMYMNIRDVINELNSDNLYTVETQTKNNMTADEINRYHLCYQRMIQYWEHLGFNGFHYTNTLEAPGHISYVIFRPENILTANNKTSGIVHTSNKKYSERILRNATLQEEKTLARERETRTKIEEKKASVANFLKFPNDPEHAQKRLISYEYWTRHYFNEILPKIKEITKQPENGYHGLNHTNQVAIFGITLAIAANTNPELVALAAGLHDCARTNDKYDLKHGPKCRPIAEKFLTQNATHLFPGEHDKIINAIVNHTNGTIPPDMISGCLWDADRIRLSWERGYEARYFSTESGHVLARMNTEQQDMYINTQNKFLMEHGITKNR